MAVHNPDYWSDYFTNSRHPHRDLTHTAIRHWKIANPDGKQGEALDLGAGKGGDSKLMRKAGFRVAAVDFVTSHLEPLAEVDPDLVVHNSRIEDFTIHPDSYDLVLALYSLSFISDRHFADVLYRVKRSLKPNGVFLGNFFGPRDHWRQKHTGNSMTFLQTKREVEWYLRGLRLPLFVEQDELCLSDLGTEEHRHVFHFIAVNDC
ncbi:MAG TPA: class I SAM-dependent methyltransferase [Candidatus Acidoferrum sp.]|nr:class I SAM-dependent methyltransferase [Candidatus Acidoferrum sp.]